MLKIIIASATIRNMAGNSKATGKPYDLNFQDAWFHLVNKDGTAEPYPQKVEIMLDKAKDGAALYFTPGEYFLDPSSIYVDRAGKLAVAPRLIQATKVPRSAA